MAQEIEQTGKTGVEALPTQRNGRSPCWATPASVMPALGRNLALVRPVGMSEDAATEWLLSAAAELDGYRQDQIEQALSEARRKCTHHGQILPFVFDWLENRANLYNYRARRAPERRPAPKIADGSTEVAGLIGAAAKALQAGRA